MVEGSSQGGAGRFKAPADDPAPNVGTRIERGSGPRRRQVTDCYKGALAQARDEPRGAHGRPPLPDGYSHSMVAGGFDERSSATRFTAGISFVIRLEITSSRS
jgi:hypothetical protein